jgi:RNA polymerase sigma-70 factor (ECF subfamily)
LVTVEVTGARHYDLWMYTTPPSLLERLQSACDDHAWALFVSLYTPYIFSLARKAGLAREEASDVVQDVLLLLTKKMPDFRYDATLSFRAWLGTVVRNRIHEIARRRSLPILPGALHIELAESVTPESIEDIEYRRHLIARALEIMQRDFSDTTWKACWEHVVSGRTASDVGQELGISEGAVYVAKCRVLQRLREELKGLL